VVVKLPIFPLPNSILYPGVYAPLHIFEDRYKLMVRHVEDAGGELAISYAPELQDGKFFPSMICGAGTVKILRRYDTGEADILVFGTRRIKFHRYAQEIPYLIGEGEVIPMKREMPEKTEQMLLTEIRDMLINWIFTQFDDSARPIQFFKNIVDLDSLCNFVASYFLPDMEQKQKMLEENELEVKGQHIWQVLKNLESSSDKGPVSTTLIFPGGQSGNTGGEPLN